MYTMRIIMNVASVLRRQSRDTNRNIKRSVLYCRYGFFLSDEGPILETLHYTTRIGSTPTYLYFDLYVFQNSASQQIRNML